MEQGRIGEEYYSIPPVAIPLHSHRESIGTESDRRRVFLHSAGHNTITLSPRNNYFMPIPLLFTILEYK